MCSSTGPKVFGPPQGLQTSGSFQAPVTYAGSAQPTTNVGTPPLAPAAPAPTPPAAPTPGGAQPTTGSPIFANTSGVNGGGAPAASPGSDMVGLTNNPFQYASGGRFGAGGRSKGNPIFQMGRS